MLRDFPPAALASRKYRSVRLPPSLPPMPASAAPTAVPSTRTCGVLFHYQLESTYLHELNGSVLSRQDRASPVGRASGSASEVDAAASFRGCRASDRGCALPANTDR